MKWRVIYFLPHHRWFLSLLILNIFLNSIAFAGESLYYKEATLLAGYSDVDKFITQSGCFTNSVGFEYYKKYSTQYRDYLTTDLQLRLSNDTSKSSNESCSIKLYIEIHNAWAEYKLKPKYKLKFGHFDPAFGIEPVLDTHGTLLQTQAKKNIGFKKDWGIALKVIELNYDYEVALSLGSGMSIRRKDGSYLLTSRTGKSKDEFQYGFSILYGKVLQSEGMSTIPENKLISDKTVKKRRIGLDGQYLFGPYLFKGEIAYGENNDKEVLGYWLETDYTLPSEQRWQIQVQFQSWINDLKKNNSDDTTLILGASYKLNPEVTLQANYSHDFHLTNKDADRKILFQLYYYSL